MLVVGCLLVLSDSRAAWLAVLLALAWLLCRAAGIRWTGIPVGLKIVAAVVFAGVLCALYGYKKGSADARLLIWRVSCRMFVESPVTGSGIASYASRYMDVQSEYFAENPQSPFLDVAGNNHRAFNEFIRVGCEQGAVGLLLAGVMTIHQYTIGKMLGTVLVTIVAMLALVFISLLGFGTYNVILALGIAFIPSYARVIRGEFARQREMNYVKNARLMGASHLRIMLVHILPNTRQVLLPTLAIGFNNAVLAEASMSFLGIGVKPPEVSLGYMMSESQSYMVRAPWYMLTCGSVIVLLILGVSLIGDPNFKQKPFLLRTFLF